jgi:hypothetical protein
MTGQTNPDLRIGLQTSTRFWSEDRNDPGFHVKARLHGGGVLTFTVITCRGNLRGSVRGHEFFEATLRHFGQGVLTISASWSDARPAYLTNLDLFNAHTKRGASKEQAAFATKTGEWAKAAGFTLVQDVDTTPLDAPGAYEQVLVDFVKPPQE